MESINKDKRHFVNKKDGDVVNLPINFRREYLSPSDSSEILEMPITGLRIIFKVLNLISNHQFRRENERQRQLMLDFENEFRVEDNICARFTFPVKDVEKHRNYKKIEYALGKLESYKKEWHKSKNAKGEIIKSLGGLIKEPQISKGNITFLVPTYWLERLISLESYNQIIHSISYSVSNTKQFLFYLWLEEIPKNGTRISFDKIQRTYQYEYKKTYDFVKFVLMPMRKIFDAEAPLSFNYKVEGDLIHIIPYLTVNSEMILKSKTARSIKSKQRLEYWTKRHQLTKVQAERIKTAMKTDDGVLNLFNSAYNCFKAKCKEDSRTTVSFKASKFINKFQSCIEDVYSNSKMGEIAPKGFPMIK